eukprot:4008819-Amphidinium_carterae.1
MPFATFRSSCVDCQHSSSKQAPFSLLSETEDLPPPLPNPKCWERLAHHSHILGWLMHASPPAQPLARLKQATQESLWVRMCSPTWQVSGHTSSTENEALNPKPPYSPNKKDYITLYPEKHFQVGCTCTRTLVKSPPTQACYSLFPHHRYSRLLAVLSFQ